MDGENQVFSKLINDFNKYAVENDIDIQININLFTFNNSTINPEEFESTIETLLKMNETMNKYDLYIYDGLYTNNFGPYLYDLKSILPEKHINMYDDTIIKETSLYDNHIVSLPITLGYKTLYSNEKILKKYNKTIPKTWDEFLTTSKYIMDEEYKSNNMDFLPYNGFFDGKF
ncbi:hypothetical protein PIROE2DRAFT_2131 [Piromyces sp. E2]|nr:hypothetical protein PIROE2DRAFT_2131 [Piromyces sp. E2]|eukprot:OUM69931.1 hypothetical protein PIROE2DRAFT_2131 [Piromyces sp. E2]